MRPVARLGDRTTGTCSHPSHKKPITIGGTIIQGSPTVTSSNLSNARFGDAVITDCGHLDVIISSSSKFTANNIGVARVGDKTGGKGIYNAVIITGDTRTTTP